VNKSDWMDICAQVCNLWPNDPVPPDTAVAWFPLLADLDTADVQLAVQALRLDPSQRFAPTPGVIRDACTPQVGSWADAIPEILRRLSRSQARADDGTEDAICAYIRTLGNLRELRWNPADPTTRAQFRDWWQDHHRRQALDRRRTVALSAADQTPALGPGAAA
jgi:hypothetical protein